MIMFYNLILNLFQYKKRKFSIDKLHQRGLDNSRKKGKTQITWKIQEVFSAYYVDFKELNQLQCLEIREKILISGYLNTCNQYRSWDFWHFALLNI